LLAGLLTPLTGSVASHGTEHESRRQFGYVGHQDAVKPTLTALENLTFWSALSDRREAMSRARLALDAFDIGRLADLPGRILSAGQKRRLNLGRLLVAPARIWLLDEPSVALDRDGVARLEAEIARHQATGGAVIAATHQALAINGAETLALDNHRPQRANDR
jgi:heme exporter protein A